MAKSSTKPIVSEELVIASLHPPHRASKPIIAPLVEASPAAYVSMHVNVHLTTAQGRSLKALASGLDAIGATLADHRRVTSPADAVRWLLEQIEVDARST